MKHYLIFVFLIIASVAQVAWGGFMIIHGVVFPLIAVFIWWVYIKYGVNVSIWYAFVGGLVVDLLSTSLFGLHAFSLLVGVGLVVLINKYLLQEGWFSRVVSLIALSVAYLLIVINIS